MNRIFSQRGQLDLPFNWIYVLLAGGVILLFFVGVVVKQKDVATQQLGTDINQILSSIATAAAAAESTKVVVETSGLADDVLYFECRNAQTEYGIKGKGSPVTDPIIPLFAPAEINSRELLLWSLPYLLPYKVTDFLYITAPTIQYILVGNDARVQEFLKESKSGQQEKFVLSVAKTDDLSSFSPQKGKQSFRIIDYTGLAVQSGGIVPVGLQSLEDRQVSAVTFNSGAATFFVKKGTVWQSEGSTPLFSLGGDLDAVYYAAVFSGHKEMFECGMQKAFQRLKYVSDVYEKKGLALENSPGAQEGNCPVLFSGLPGLLLAHHGDSTLCSEFYPENCVSLVQKSGEIRSLNQQLFSANCPPLY
ncbi:hypothetical protein HY495_01830 [Candidatus Woesearchaeota archaeon]|nr:hypothetical protein [Candidatus Woesearchaeota archaeon]